ncbi:MAG: hypothetical protein ABJC05_11605 [Pyrinomonadaceae bacterium]
MHIKLRMLAALVVACISLVGMQAIASAQGRSGGHAQGGPPAGRSGGGPPAGVGVDRGINTSSDRSNGRADTGRDTASDRSNGRSDQGLERAHLRRENAERADRELNDHRGMAASLHTTANDLRAGYQAALLTNPSLKFGQYVAATRIAAHLGATNPNITRAAILTGLANGKSIGQTLHDLGVSDREAKEAKKRVEREIKAAKRS